MSDTVYLITGGNRGIGKGLVEHYLARPHNTVVVGVRNPNDKTVADLSTLPTGDGSKLIVVKIDSLSETDALEAVELLKSKHGIQKLDVVVANSGVSKYYGPVTTTPLQEFRDHYNVNIYGPVLLFQATAPLLEAAPTPKFIAVSTGLASIASIEEMPVPSVAYSSSKTALNYVVAKIHAENPKLIAFPISPGWVQTEMGNAGAAATGMAEAPTTLKECIDGFTHVIDTATREKTSGTFQNAVGPVYPW